MASPGEPAGVGAGELPPAPAAERVTPEPTALPPPRPRAIVGVRLGRRDMLGRRLLVGADLISLAVAMILASVIAGFRPDATAVLLYGLPTLPVWILLFKLYGLYDRDMKRISHSGLDDLPWLFHALVIGTLFFWLYVRVVPGDRLIFAETASFGLAAIVAITFTRNVARGALVWLLGPERVLIGGDGATPELLIRKIGTHPEYGLEPIALLSPGGRRPIHSVDSAPGSLPVVGGADDLEAVIAEWRPERLVVCRPDFSPQEVFTMIDTCRRHSVKASVVPGTVDAFGPSLEVDEVEGVTVLGVNPPILGRTSRALKRYFDLVVAGLILVLAAPLMALIALAIRLDSKGPALFRQPRVGREDRHFDVIKFRTMVADAEVRRAELMSESRSAQWLDLERDPRVTRVGGLLRRTSLDELPQLINVIRGEMSLVGPRPLPAEEDAQVDGWGRGRLDLTPGVTGLWQVLGRTRIPFDEMVKLDYIYVTNWSLWGDVRLLLRTLPAVLRRHGAN